MYIPYDMYINPEQKRVIYQEPLKEKFSSSTTTAIVIIVILIIFVIFMFLLHHWMSGPSTSGGVKDVTVFS